jgi:capsular polysaccharide biosynthesis protein
MGDEKSVVRAFELGANDYVAKPFNIDTLRARIEAHIRVKRKFELTLASLRAIREVAGQVIFSSLLKRWWLVLAAVLVGLGITIAYSYSQTPAYSATATFLVSPRIRSTDPSDLINSQDTLAGRSAVVTTYCDIFESDSLTQAAAINLNLDPSLIRGYSVSCAVFPDSSILALEVRGQSPYLTADLANAIGDVSIPFIKELQEVYDIRILDPATPDTDPISPDQLVDLVLGLLISLLLGMTLVMSEQGIFLSLGRSSEMKEQPSVRP